MFLKKLVVGPIQSNCYLVGADNKEGMVIDPGSDAANILKEIKAQGLKTKIIVLTHGHPDHVGGIKGVQAATGAEVAIHPDDVKIMAGTTDVFMDPTFQPPPTPTRLLKDGEEIKIGELTFKVIHTPGHSPGCICLFGHGVLFSGDTLFNFGIGRFDLPGGNHRRLMESLHLKVLTLPPDTIVYPGHGPKTTIGAEKQGNPFLNS